VRTTLTLDEDIAAKLKAESRRSGRPFKEVVNDALRKGLSGGTRKAGRPTFKVQPRDLGALRPGLSVDDIEGLIEQIEGPLHR